MNVVKDGKVYFFLPLQAAETPPPPLQPHLPHKHALTTSSAGSVNDLLISDHNRVNDN